MGAWWSQASHILSREHVTTALQMMLPYSNSRSRGQNVFETVTLSAPVELLKLRVKVVQLLGAPAAIPLPWQQEAPATATASAALLLYPPVCIVPFF